jgi:hypothetical protein
MVRLYFLDESYVELHKATREQLTKWINEAHNKENRSARKQVCYAAMYSAGAQKLIDIMKEAKQH